MDIILVGYTPERTRRALALCARMFDKLPSRRRILVLNHPDVPVHDEAAGWEVIRGSNVLGEFSGWQEGLDVLSASGDAEAIVFLNDTVGAYSHLSMFPRWCLRREIRAMGPNCMIGFTQGASGLYGELTVGTFCFVLPSEVLAKLQRRLWSAAEIEEYVRGGTDESRFFTAKVPADVQERLRWWLFEGWHRSEALDAESQYRLHFKARCMFAEFLLSARCRRLGVEIRDPMTRHPVASALDALNNQRYRVVSRLKAILNQRSAQRDPFHSCE